MNTKTCLIKPNWVGRASSRAENAGKSAAREDARPTGGHISAARPTGGHICVDSLQSKRREGLPLRPSFCYVNVSVERKIRPPWQKILLKSAARVSII